MAAFEKNGQYTGIRMNQIDKYYIINEGMLDQGHYFESFFQEACRNNLINDSEMEQIQMEMVELLEKEIDRYTNGESSSVPVEKAQAIFQSIVYCIGLYLKSFTDMDVKLKQLKTEKMQVLFHRGMDYVSNLKSDAFILLKNLQKSGIRVNNYAWQDTIFTGLPEFFHDYNVEFGADEIPGSIDYPVCETVTDFIGVEYIHEYLSRLTLETKFCKHFSENKIGRLLKGFDREAEHMLINIFDLMLTNALGCELAGLNLLQIAIPEPDQRWLQKNLSRMTMEEIQNKICSSFHQVCIKLNLEPEIASYSEAAVKRLAVRLKNNLETDTLERLFISLKTDQKMENTVDEGIEMEDSALRKLIDEINRIESVQQKVKKIREMVKNRNDFTEILEECFIESEYRQVFQLLNETERLVLKMRILEDAGPEGRTDYIPEKAWQKVLFDME